MKTLYNRQYRKNTKVDEIMKVHCFFEQSGTFKNAFKKYGIEAYDYDIQNEFGETDCIIDLFREIEKAYKDEPSLFDEIKTDDLIFAFFPCTYFSDQSHRHLCCTAFQYRNYTIEQKCEVAIKRHKQLNLFYEMLNKLVIVCQRRNIKLIIENPLSTSGMQYLTHLWCLKPTIIDKDRTKNGDYFKKPTQYWFIGIQPKDNFLFEPLQQVDFAKQRYCSKKNNPLGVNRKIMRSMIHPQYADRFIRQYILDEQVWK